MSKIKDKLTASEELSRFLDKERPTRYDGMEAVFDVLRSGTEAKQVITVDKVIKDSGFYHVFLKFINGKTYHIQISEVSDE